MATSVPAPTSMMERILHLMAEKKASDVYLSAHAPATIKINGQCVPINAQVLPPEAVMNLLIDVVPPNRIEELKETGELNMAIPMLERLIARMREIAPKVPVILESKSKACWQATARPWWPRRSNSTIEPRRVAGKKHAQRPSIKRRKLHY